MLPQFFTLNDGNKIPRLGFGTWRSSRGAVKNAILEAAKAGVRHFDCAAIYENESEIGEAFDELFTKGGFKRDEFFITSKVWNTDHRPERVGLLVKKH